MNIDAIISKWPDKKPDFPFDDRGWFPQANQDVLAGFLNTNTTLVIELGSWLGLSTRWILDHAHNAKVIAVDHWLGSENTGEKEFNLYEKFLSNCWGYQDRIILVKQTTEVALPILTSVYSHPNLVYVDAGHDYKSASHDIRASMGFNCTLVGDDFNPNTWGGVVKAVWEEAANFKRPLAVWGSCWSMPK